MKHKQKDSPEKSSETGVQTASIRGRILGISISILTIALLVSGGVSAVLNYKSTSKTLESTLSEMAVSAAQTVSKQIELYECLVQEIATSQILSSDESTDAEKVAFLEQKKEQYHFTTFGYAKADGIDLVSKRDMSKQPAFKQAINAKLYVSEPVVAADTKSAAIFLAAPVKKDGKVHSAIFFAMDAKILNDIVTNMNMGETGGAYILDKTGNTIAHKNIDLVTMQSNVQNDALTDPSLKKLAVLEKEMMEGKSGFNTYTYGGITKLMTYAPIDGTNGWSIAITAAKDEYYRATTNTIVICLLLTVVFLAISIILLYLFSNTVTQPIIQCVQRLRLLAQGDLHSPVPQVKVMDETGVLAQTTATLIEGLYGLVHEMSTALTNMAKGDFSMPELSIYPQDFEPLSVASNTIINSLNNALGQINESSDQVSSGSQQVSSGAQALAQGATQQAGAVEELCASISDISNYINQNAQHASDANRITESADRKLREGNEKMKQMLHAMDGISESSIKISHIIKTINDIAFQTNILALNAAVEAARAGEAGKGFAVVADEVRALAGKSAEAVQDTTALIEDSIHSVQSGKQIADATARTLYEMIEDFKQSTALVSLIANASHEQSLAIGQVTIGIDQISTVVQTNSATAEQSAASSQELNSQARTLKSLIERFKLR